MTKVENVENVENIENVKSVENVENVDENVENIGSTIFLVENFLEQNYEFRRNLLNGKTEFAILQKKEDDDKQEKEGYDKATLIWNILTKEDLNSIVRRAKKLGIGGKSSPKQDIEEYIESKAIIDFDPIKFYLHKLPVWDGKNHVAELFGRIPGITSEQLGWCATWLRSAVAHWLHMDMLHGNEVTPVFIGKQGCGKSTFANRLLPEELRQYFLDHINFNNKFDTEMALTHNLFVNIDEFANMGPSQQGRLKQILSKVKVNGRPIFGKSQDDRIRYASFLATTNDEHPLCDPTGSRRFICIRIPAGKYIDNGSPINYEQLYAQVVYELTEQKVPYWFCNEEVARIQERNYPFFKSDDVEGMLKACFRTPKNQEEGRWMTIAEIFKVLQEQYPMLIADHRTKIRIGQAMKFLNCERKRTNKGPAYYLCLKMAKTC